MPKFLLSAFADEYSASLDKQLEGLSLSGIRMIEPRFIDGANIAAISAKEATRVAKILDSAGISVYSVGSPIGKIALDGDHAAHLDSARQAFENAAILSAKRVRVFSYYLPTGVSRTDARREVIDRLGTLLELADEYGLTLCHENEARIYGESPADAHDLITSTGGRLRAVFDMGNLALMGYDPMSAYRLLAPYIEYFHIKDALSAGAIVPPGLGEAMIPEILRLHAEDRANTVLTLEPHLETFSGLGRLTDSTFDNPYKYETPESAFLDAAARLKKIITAI